MKEHQFSTVIKPKSKLLDFHLDEVLHYKDLIFLFVKRNFVSKYKQTILGPAWAIIQPLLTTVVFTLVFGNIAGLAAKGIPSFIFYLGGTVLWSYFSQCLVQTSNTFISNSGILGKVYFPRLVMPISSVMSNLISLAIQFTFFIAFWLYFWLTDQGVHPNAFILMVPALVIQMAALGLGCGVIISALTTKYRDLHMLVDFGVQLWMYATPVAYDMFELQAFMPGGGFHTLYMLNPVTSIINIFRYAFFGIGQIEWTFYAIGWATTIVLLFVGVMLFSRVEKTFMDTV